MTTVIMVSIKATPCTMLLSVLVYVVSMSNSTFSSDSGLHVSSAVSEPSVQLLCPPGFIYSADTNNCECYPNSNVVCNEQQEASLEFGYCMTYEEGEGTFLGVCGSFLAHGRSVTNRLYLELPGNLTDLNDFMCAPMSRKGLICSECIDGFAPAITSFGYQCSNCTESAWYGVPLFLFLEFVPITIFYFIIITFRISVTTAPMTSFVLFSQLAAHLFTVFISLTAVIENEYGSGMIYFIKLITTLYGIWNLDFFRYLIPPFCISPRLKLIHIFSLYYISAFYPLVLIGITWACIELRSRNFKPLTWIWGLMKKCYCKRSRGQADSKSTIIDAFATFFLLSYTRLLFTSLYFLITLTIEKNGSTFRVAAGLDPTSDYFSKNHAPFAVLAILILIGPVLIPVTVLTFYPVRVFRSLLQKCKISGHLWAALNIFVEKFHSCYRDGLDGGKDLRCFVCLPFLLRLSILIGAFTPTFATFWFFHFLVYGGASLLIAIVQPYKRAYMNIIDSLILAIISLVGILYILYLNPAPSEEQNSTFFLILLCLDFTLPLFGIITIIIFKLFKNKIPTNWIHACSKNCCRPSKTDINASAMDEGNNEARRVTTTTMTEMELPDRILHPDCYVEERINDT